jgi:hypothetical protein
LNDGEPMLNARQLGELLGLEPGTVLDHYEAGDIPGFNLYGKERGPVRFYWSEVAAEAETWRNRPPRRRDEESASKPRPAPRPNHYQSEFPSPANPSHLPAATDEEEQ